MLRFRKFPVGHKSTGFTFSGPIYKGSTATLFLPGFFLSNIFKIWMGQSLTIALSFQISENTCQKVYY